MVNPNMNRKVPTTEVKNDREPLFSVNEGDELNDESHMEDVIDFDMNKFTTTAVNSGILGDNGLEALPIFNQYSEAQQPQK